MFSLGLLRRLDETNGTDGTNDERAVGGMDLMNVMGQAQIGESGEFFG
jgi:hypothetical protein